MSRTSTPTPPPQEDMDVNQDTESQITDEQLTNMVERQTKLKLPQVKLFSGGPNDNARHFLLHLDRYLENANATLQQKFDYFPSYLEGRALYWYERVKNECTTWTELREKFSKEFIESNKQFKLMRFHKIYQLDSETVEEYRINYEQASQGLDISDESRLWGFINGLLPILRTYVLSLSPDTYRKATELSRLGEYLAFKRDPSWSTNNSKLSDTDEDTNEMIESPNSPQEGWFAEVQSSDNINSFDKKMAQQIDLQMDQIRERLTRLEESNMAQTLPMDTDLEGTDNHQQWDDQMELAH